MTKNYFLLWISPVPVRKTIEMGKVKEQQDHKKYTWLLNENVPLPIK